MTWTELDREFARNDLASHAGPRLYEGMDEVLQAVRDLLVRLSSDGGSLDLRLPLRFWPRGKPNPFRLSSSGSCARKLAYRKLVPEKQEPLSARALGVFMHGDVLHETERHLIGMVAELHSVERKVQLSVPGPDGSSMLVSGHCDGIVRLEGREAVVDIKTASTYSFKRIVQEGPGYEYRAQMNAYMEATGLRESYLWMYDKNTSERAVVRVAYDPAVVEDIRERFRRVRDATLDDLPERAFAPEDEIRQKKPTGRKFLPWQCSYCDFTSTCWGPLGFERVIEGEKVRYIQEPADRRAAIARLDEVFAAAPAAEDDLDAA